jgi:transmembrane sensor
MSADPSPAALEAGEWCRRIAEHPLSMSDRLAFDRWIEAAPENRQAFDRASFIWRALDGSSAPQELVDIRVDALSALHNKGMKLTRARLWMAAAASVALLLAASGWWFSIQPTSYSTGIGERRIVLLEDGSRVSLDAASRVDVDYEDHQRMLRLVGGRARFDVGKDPLRPFTVAAGDKLVVATGTSFSVERLPSSVEVVLYEGHVAVLRSVEGGSPRPVALDKARTVEQALKAGTEVALSDRSEAPKMLGVDPAKSASWETGQLSFTNEPLGLAVERINRYSQVPIAVADQETAALPIDGVFNASDPAAFVEGVTGVFPVRSRKVGGRIVLALSR